MKILIVSDTEDKYIWDHFDHERFKDVELVLSCGDVKAEYLSFLVTLIRAPLFYVHGNHNDNYDINPPEGCVSIDGKFIIYNNIRIAGLGGSMRYNKGIHQYTDKQMKRRISRLKWKIRRQKGLDILLTHAPAFGMNDGGDLCHKGFKSFYILLDKHSPKYFIHGHQHMNYKFQPRLFDYKDTKVINAYGYYLLEY